MEEAERVYIDEALSPRGQLGKLSSRREYEVDRIRDVRSGLNTRYGRVHRQFLVRWKGHTDEIWVDEASLNCGTLLQEFERDRARRNRFEVMQVHEEESIC